LEIKVLLCALQNSEASIAFYCLFLIALTKSKFGSVYRVLSFIFIVFNEIKIRKCYLSQSV